MTKICFFCGNIFETKSYKAKFCSKICNSRNYEKARKTKESKCIICGKIFYTRKDFNIKTCSKSCKDIYFYKKGEFRLYPYCKEHNISVEDLINKIDSYHNKDLLTLVEISKKLGIVRRTLIAICKKYNIKTRTIAEDNLRRFSLMTVEQKKIQTQKANKTIRILFQNKKWKENQIAKVLSVQKFHSSSQEELFYEKITEQGYTPIRQYTKDMQGFSLDFAFLDIKLAIEIDGEYWHSRQKTKETDKRKDEMLKNKGWEIIRIPASDFQKNTEHYIWEVIQTIETLKALIEID